MRPAPIRRRRARRLRPRNKRRRPATSVLTRTCEAAHLRALSSRLPMISPKSSGSMRTRKRSSTRFSQAIEFRRAASGPRDRSSARPSCARQSRFRPPPSRRPYAPAPVPDRHGVASSRLVGAPAPPIRNWPSVSRRRASPCRIVSGVLRPCARSPARSRALRTTSSWRPIIMLRSLISGATSSGNVSDKPMRDAAMHFRQFAAQDA